MISKDIDIGLIPAKILFKQEKSKYAYINREWQGIPSLERSKKGTLFVTYYSGEYDEGCSNYAILNKSQDNGKTWEDAYIVIKHENPKMRVFDSCLWHDPNGALWLTWNQSYGMYDGRAGSFFISCEDPDARNMIWSEPKRIGNGIMMNKPTVTADNKWLFPLALWNLKAYKVNENIKDKALPNVYETTDMGKSFKLLAGADICKKSQRNCDEHMIVELNDKSLWMLVRTKYGIGQSFSYDKGHTWTKGEDSNIKSPVSRFFIRRLNSGNLLLVNHYNFNKRNNLCASISEDEGKTWIGHLMLDERDDVSYPDGVEGNDGKIYITYDRQRKGNGDILMAVFTEDDILAGKIVSKDSKLKILVSSLSKKKNIKKIDIIRDIQIYKDDRFYSAFPSITITKENDFFVGFRQAPNRIKQYGDMSHGDPASKAVFIKSKNNGKTWDTNASVIYDDFFHGVQSPDINCLKDGTLLSTFFTWKYGELEDIPVNGLKMHAGYNKFYMELMDSYSTRSYDSGKTWDKPTLIDYFGKDSKNSLRGNVVEFDDGSIVLALSASLKEIKDRKINILKSNDQGKTWELLSVIKGNENIIYGEPNLYLTPKGKVVIMLRSHIIDENRSVYDDGNSDMSPMHFAESYDKGKTWTNPIKTNFKTPCPFEATRLNSENVLLTYGQRYSEYGIYAAILDSEMNNIGTTKGQLIKACPNLVDPHDLGYTSSILLPNGDVYVVYYMHGKDQIRFLNGTIIREKN